MDKPEQEKKKETRKEAAEWGRLAERIAVDYITRQGFPITETNWRCGNHIEIDIISIQGDEIAFVEVKARNGRYQSAEDAIDIKKMKQMVKGANAYIQQQEHDYSARFDVALVEGTPQDYEFTYLQDAFVPPLNAR